jgi:2-(1,2-epoxy-1,2-dihydrophenyl)acetyl-CoA isomerase
MSFSTIHMHVASGVATITLARPDRLNALNAVMHAELREALARVAAADEAKVLMLTGEGRAFSSGQDLTEDLPRSADGRVDLGPPLERDYNPLIKTLVDYPKLTIAALNGPAVGASANIALACDLVVAARSATIHEAFARIGLIPDAGGTWFLPRLVGPKRAMAMMIMAEPVSADQALAMGLISRVFDDTEFPVRVDAMAQDLARGPLLAYRLIKQAMRKSVGHSIEEQLAFEAAIQREAGFSRDFSEGVAAFREKRRPDFKGE